MHADSAYMIGQSHEVCQDYARAGVFPAPDVAYAIVADGCSMGKDSDVGARLLALHVERRLLSERSVHFTDTMELARMLALVSESAWRLGLSKERGALDSTLLIATADMHGARRFVAYGDGVLVARRGEGYTAIHSIEYPSGFPLYPSYLDSPHRAEAFRKNDEGRQVYKLYNAPPCSDGSWRQEASFDPPYYLLDESRRDLDLMLVFSDGIRALTRTGAGGTEAVSVLEALQLFMRFKTYAGRFIQRRLNRFLKDAAGLGWKWQDDISVAGIYLGD